MSERDPGSARWTPSGTYEAVGALPTPDSERGVSKLERVCEQLRAELGAVTRERDELLLALDEARRLAHEAADKAKAWAALVPGGRLPS